ncbi:MAG TPA: glycerophosphodiester phosphodiesterase family protein, partial [Terriglobia bacterium]|nr:glycerophosphodiester phosphodiesterase family protein [Terriglobia bacterium]
TTSGFGRVSDLPLKAIRKLDAGTWFNRRYPGKSSVRNAGLRVPLLAEVLDLVCSRQCQAWLEIKRGSKIYPGIEGKVLEEVARAGVAPLTSVISFDVTALRRCRQLDSKQALGISFTRPPLVIRKAGLVGAACVLPHGVFTSERFIARAHAAELKVVTWGLELQGPMRRRMLSGADGLITWSPGKAVKLRDQIQNEMARSRVRV